MIDQDTIRRIIDASNIVDVVSEFVSLKKRGTNYFGCCPFHNEKTPSFSVSPSKNLYKCFGCGKGGNSVNFVMEHEQMSYPEALKYLAQKAHIEIKETEFTQEEQERHDDRESMMVLNEYAKNTFMRAMTENDEGRAFGYKYFKERGFNEETIKAYELGYCLADRKWFTGEALKSGYKQKYLVGTGLSIQREDGSIFDRFSNRVMFPIHNLTGKVIGFGGRVLDARTKGVNVKYMNSPQSEIYDKSRSLYGIYQAKATIVRNDKCFLVEGYTDVLGMHQSGITNVVASNGTALTIEQIRLIHRFTSNITVLYDGDAAGIHAALRGIDMILAEEMNVKVLLLPDGEDPDSFARNHSSSELEEFIAKNETDFILFKTRLLLNDAGGDPTKLSALIGDIVTSISVVPDGIKRSVYIKECSDLMNIDEGVLHREINKRLFKRRDQQFNEEQKSENQQQIKLPANISLNQQQALVERLRDYESELLMLLIKFGNDVLFTIANDDTPAVDVSVADYIIKELDSNDIEFITPVCRRVLALYMETRNQGQKPDAVMFTLNPDVEISQFAVSLLVPKTEMSKIWDKRNRYIPPEEKNMQEVIDHALNGYKYELVQQKLADIYKSIKELQGNPDNDLKILELMSECTVYSKYNKRLSEYLRRTMKK